jgi:hypothetical protein
MGAPKPTLGYPSKTEAVLALAASGLTPRQIADRIDIELKNVVSLMISANGTKKRAKRPSEQQGRTVLFPIDTLYRLRAAAAARGITVNELARRIVETAVDEGLIDSILDDDEEPEVAHG